MKAINRCKSHNQGDRCTLEKDHDLEDGHLGNFTMWLGPSIIPLYPRTTPRRNRQMRRAYRDQESFPKHIIKFMKLSLLAKEYVKSFIKEPETK
jgi:hypothetical protein